MGGCEGKKYFEAADRLRFTGEYDPELLEAATLGVTGPVAVTRRAVTPVRPPPKPLEGKGPGMYDLPGKSMERFEADYRPEKWTSGPPVDAAGRLTRDIEGRDFMAKYVVGRRMAGGPDEAFPPEQLHALTKALTGRPVWYYPPDRMPDTSGFTLIRRPGRRSGIIGLRNDLTPADEVMVHRHEIGHAIDDIAGQLSIKGLGEELTHLYDVLNNPIRTHGGRYPAPWGGQFGPEKKGYEGTEFPREYIAEAIRAYLTNPSSMKAVAPKTAAVIRAAVNENPALRQTIQFNNIGSGFIGGTALGGGFIPDPDVEE